MQPWLLLESILDQHRQVIIQSKDWKDYLLGV